MTSNNMTRNSFKPGWLPLVALAFLPVVQAQQCPIPRHRVESADQAVELAKRAIVAYKLSDTPQQCLAVAPSPGYKGAGFELDVRENHVAGCGDALPMFDPLVMSIHVTVAGVLTTTAGAADARPVYRRPVCPRAPRHAFAARN